MSIASGNIECTGWSRWISPILEGYCGYFFLMTICFFGCILTVHQTHFVFSVQIFDIIKFLFSSQIGDNLRGTPQKVVKFITLFLENYCRYQNVLPNHVLKAPKNLPNLSRFATIRLYNRAIERGLKCPILQANYRDFPRVQENLDTISISVFATHFDIWNNLEKKFFFGQIKNHQKSTKNLKKNLKFFFPDYSRYQNVLQNHLQKLHLNF